MNLIKLNLLFAPLILILCTFLPELSNFEGRGQKHGKGLKIPKSVVNSSQFSVVAHNEIMKNYNVVLNQIHLFMEHYDQKMTNYIHLYTMSNYLHMCYCIKVHKIYNLIMLYIIKSFEFQWTCIIHLHYSHFTLNVIVCVNMIVAHQPAWMCWEWCVSQHELSIQLNWNRHHCCSQIFASI